MILHLFFKFARHQGFTLAIICGLLFIAATTELLGLASLLPVAMAIFQPGTQHVGIALSVLSHLGVSEPSPFAFLILVAVALSIRGGVLLLAYRLVAISSTELEAKLATRAMTSTMSAKWGYISRLSSGQLIDAVTRLPSETGVTGPILAQFLVGSTLAAIFIGAVAYISPATLITAVGIGVPLAVCLKLTSGQTIRASNLLSPIQGLRNRLALELVGNAKYFKTGNALPPALSKFEVSITSVKNLNRRVMTAQAIMATIPETLVALGIAALIGVVYGFGLDGGSGFILALMLVYRAFHYTNQTLAAAHALSRYLPSFGHLDDYIRAADFHSERISASESEIIFKNEVQFQNVSFEYTPGTTIIESFSAKLCWGETLLLKGESGAGKTTILDMLTGLISPTTGTILVDGIELNDLNRASWRRKIAYIPQDPPLFAGTIRDNLCSQNGSISDDELLAVLRIVQLDDLIRERENGLSTEIGERGIAISGGQRQRLVLARALLSNAELIVLDEPTSAIDPRREALIFEQIFKELKGKKTLVMAVHRYELDTSIGRTIEIFPNQ